MKIRGIEDLFLIEIRQLYDTEEKLVKALSKMAKASSSERLRAAFQHHLDQTMGQIQRLESVFAEAGIRASGEPAKTIKGLVDDAEEIISAVDQSPLRDAGLIAAGNCVEHYEIARYGTARDLAYALGYSRSARLLEETLQEEKQADAILTRIAEETVNQEALQLGAHQEQ